MTFIVNVILIAATIATITLVRTFDQEYFIRNVVMNELNSQYNVNDDLVVSAN